MIKIKGLCPKCNSEYGEVITANMHHKLICSDCKTYIKMVSKKEYATMQKENQNTPNTIDGINFKLDLIIDHLGIKQ